jgi:hypothetical protein
MIILNLGSLARSFFLFYSAYVALIQSCGLIELEWRGFWSKPREWPAHQLDLPSFQISVESSGGNHLYISRSLFQIQRKSCTKGIFRLCGALLTLTVGFFPPHMASPNSAVEKETLCTRLFCDKKVEVQGDLQSFISTKSCTRYI